MDTTDAYREKEAAERAARKAWEHYSDLVKYGGSGDDRLNALRSAISADKEVTSASREWRRVCGVGW